MNYKAICLTISLLAAIPAQARELEVCGNLQQGELLLGKTTAPATEVLFGDNKPYPVDAEGNFILALPRDAAPNAELLVYYTGDAGMFYQLPIAPTKWDIQRINGVAQQKVTPDASHTKEIEREQKDVRQALATTDAGSFWKEGFILPVEGRISGHFGNQRIFNGTPKSPHSGTDIAAPEGTPVKASAGGKVVLSGKDYFYSGNMVIIDHGQGLQTIYAHLQKATVQAGEEVKQGQIIGLVGKTGRATGPHLHWGASLNNIRFRPHSLLDLNRKKCRTLTGSYLAD